MVTVICTKAYRNNKNKIYGYNIQDLYGQSCDISPENLKQAITNKQISVTNITLTSDGRLIIKDRKTVDSLDKLDINELDADGGKEYFRQKCFNHGINYQEAIRYKHKNSRLSDEEIFEHFRKLFIIKCREAGLTKAYTNKAIKRRRHPSWSKYTDEAIINRIKEELNETRQRRESGGFKGKCERAGVNYSKAYSILHSYKYYNDELTKEQAEDQIIASLLAKENC